MINHFDEALRWRSSRLPRRGPDETGQTRDNKAPTTNPAQLQPPARDLFSLLKFALVDEDRAQAEQRLHVPAVAQIDGFLEGAFRIGNVFQRQVGNTHFVIRLIITWI